jgi:hypothetical protein
MTVTSLLKKGVHLIDLLDALCKARVKRDRKPMFNLIQSLMQVHDSEPPCVATTILQKPKGGKKKYTHTLGRVLPH